MMKIKNTIKQYSLMSFLTTENIVLLFLLFFGLLFRLLTVMNIETGGDAAGVWFFAKKLFYGLHYDLSSHHSVRFGMIIPVFLIQCLFGTHPVVYYITPLIFFLLQIIFLYKIGVRAHGINLAYLSSILLIFLPQMFTHAVQIKPDGFSAAYILISVYLLFKFQDSEKNSYLYIILSSIFMFLAYLSKETSLFILPGIVISIWVMRKEMRYVIIFCALLLVLFLGETAIYHFVAGLKFGRAEIIMGSHLSSGNLQALPSFRNLFYRYAALNIFDKIYFFAYIIGTCFLVIWAKRIKMNKKIKSLFIIPFAFFILLTFAVKSIDPVIPAMSFNPRHLVPAEPFMTLVISYFLIVAFSSLQATVFKGLKKPVHLYAGITGFISIICLLTIIIATPHLPSQFRRDNFLGEHPFRLAFQYHKLLSNAYTNGIPIIQEKIIANRFKIPVDAVQEYLKKGYSQKDACIKAGIVEKDYLYSLGRVQKGDYKTFKIFTHIFRDGDFSSKDNFTFPEMEEIEIKNKSIGFMVKDELKKQTDYRSQLFNNEENQVVVMLEKPFRVKQIKLKEYLN